MKTFADAIGGKHRVIGGPFGSKLTQKDYQTSGVPVIRGSNMGGESKSIGGQFAFVSWEKFERDLKRNVAKPGDIIVTQRGTLGQVAVVPDDTPFPAYVVSQSQMAVRVNPKFADRDFLYYFLTSPDFLNFIELSTIQTGVPHINLGLLRELKVDWPKPPTQRAIAATLGALDDKIELNRRMNATLEATARALFRDWFVDFGPTRAKMADAEPYLAPEIWDLFPDRLDEDGKPEGWESRPLDEVADFLNGLALQKFPAKDGEDSLPVIKIAELRNGITAKSNRASRDVPKKYVIEDGDFLFSWSGSLIAKFWTNGEGALNQHLFKVTSDEYPAWFYTQWVHHHLEEFQRIAASKATTMGHIQRGHLKAAMTVCPPSGELEKIGSLLDAMTSRLVRNELEARSLAETRDYLLPRLMSGEVLAEEAAQLQESAE